MDGSVKIYALLSLMAVVGMRLYSLRHFSGLSYPLVELGWLMTSLSLMSTGLIFCSGTLRVGGFIVC